MHIYRLRLQIASTVAYSSQIVGDTAITAPLIGNYALTYALQPQIQRYTYVAEQPGRPRPTYGADLNPFAGRWYITPAQPERLYFETFTYRTSREIVTETVVPAARNRPSFGQITGIAPGSIFVAYVISSEPYAPLPVIHLGVWAGEADIDYEALEVVETTGRFRAAAPLNPLDLPNDLEVPWSELQMMPPVPLHTRAECIGPYYRLAGEPVGGLPPGLPAGLRYQIDDALMAGETSAGTRPQRRRPRGEQ